MTPETLIHEVTIEGNLKQFLLVLLVSLSIVSIEATKFLKFPTNAKPLGPTKTAITLEVTSPIEILSAMLTPFREAILNKSFFDMDLKKRT